MAYKTSLSANLHYRTSYVKQYAYGAGTLHNILIAFVELSNIYLC